MVNNKNESYNSTIKAKPNYIWTEENYYTNVKNRQQDPEPEEEEGITPETIRKETVNNIRERAKKQLEKNKIVELNVGDWVRVKMSALYSELRKAIKQGNKKLINVTYTPEIYRVFKVIDEVHPSYERKRYTLKNLDGEPLYTESKINEMTHSHRYRRLFASDLLKVDKDTRNVSFNNNRANQLNQINRLVVEKPIVEKEKVNRVPKDKTIAQEPQEIVRRSTRVRKENKNDDYVY
jgi:IS4 transposase